MLPRRSLAPLLAAFPTALAAQTSPPWNPDRPIRFLVGFAAGGSTDITARVVAQAITAGMGQPVLVENRTGAAGNIASEHVARSAPDGHTLVVGSMGTHATNAALYRNMSFDVVRDFAPVSLVVLSSNLVALHPAQPFRRVSELIAYARANPGKLNCGIAGAGSSQHFAAAMFEHAAGVRFTQISFRGGAPAMAELAAGRIDLVFSPVVEAVELVRGGPVRAIAITRSQRAAQMPDLPTVSEDLPGYTFSSWLGVFAPAATPAPIILRFSREIAAAMRRPEIRARMEQLGYEPVGSTPEEFASFQRAELPRVTEMVRISGATVE